jgi:hypothetical protein
MIHHRLEYGDKRTRPIWSWRWKLLFIALGLAVPAVISFLPIWPVLNCPANDVYPPPSSTTIWKAGYFSLCD